MVITRHNSRSTSQVTVLDDVCVHCSQTFDPNALDGSIKGDKSDNWAHSSSKTSLRRCSNSWKYIVVYGCSGCSSKVNKWIKTPSDLVGFKEQFEKQLCYTEPILATFQDKSIVISSDSPT